MRNRFGIRTSYQASNAIDSGLEADRDFSPQACEEVGFEGSDCGYRTTIWDIDLNAFASLGWRINQDHNIKYTNLLLRSSQQQVEIQQGRTNSEDLANFTRFDWKEQQVWSHAFDGEHFIDLLDDELTEVTWFANYTKASRDVPLRRRYTYVLDVTTREFEMLRRSDSNRTEFGMLDDESIDMGFKIKQPLYLGGRALDIKFGASYNEKNRDSSYLKYGYDLRNVSNDELRQFIPEIIFGPTNIAPGGVFLDEFFDASNAFTANFENKQFFRTI